MSVDNVQTLKIAHLAKLSLTENELPQYTADLNKMLLLIDQMNTVNTMDILPMSHPRDATQSLRPDTVTETDEHLLFHSLTKTTQDSLYLVPQVIDS